VVQTSSKIRKFKLGKGQGWNGKKLNRPKKTRGENNNSIEGQPGGKEGGSKIGWGKKGEKSRRERNAPFVIVLEGERGMWDKDSGKTGQRHLRLESFCSFRQESADRGGVGAGGGKRGEGVTTSGRRDFDGVGKGLGNQNGTYKADRMRGNGRGHSGEGIGRKG